MKSTLTIRNKNFQFQLMLEQPILSHLRLFSPVTITTPVRRRNITGTAQTQNSHHTEK